MASIKLKGDTSGEVTISAPSVAGTTTLELPATSSTLATQNSLGVRNLIINGDMRIAQRGTSSSSYSSGDTYLTLDRWRSNLSSAGTWTMSQDTDVPTGQGFATSLKWDCTTANPSLSAGSYMFFTQYFEGQNLQHLKKGTSNAESVTLSFWVKSNKTGTYTVFLYDVDNTRLISKSYTIDTADTWEKKTITFAGDTSGILDNDNARSLDIRFMLVAGTDWSSGTLQTSWAANVTANRAVGQVNLADSTSNYINITGVQLEVGTEATPFEHRPYDMELQRCMRYFQTSYVYGSTIGSSFSNGSANALQQSWGSSNASSIGGGTWKLPVTMRTSGTLTTYDQAGTSGKYTQLSAGGLPTNGATPIQRISDNAFIPFDEANTDYQEYLEWVAEGNTPEEAE
jgi:hypothetical protein